MSNNFFVYTQPACQPCRMTKKLLSDLDLRTEEFQAADHLGEFDARDAERMAPLVVVFDENDIELDHWTGFRPDRIKEYA